MHRHELSVLSTLKEAKRLSFDELLDRAELGKDEAMWAIANLLQAGFVEVKKEGAYEWSISREGEEYAKSELPEVSLLKKIPTTGGIALSMLTSKQDQIGLSWAKKKGLVEIVVGGVLKLTEEGKQVSRTGMETDSALKELYKNENAFEKYKESEAVRELEQRKLIEVKSRESIKEVEITQQGVLALAKERQEEAGSIDSLDRSIIANRNWAGRKFKPYNISAPVEPSEVAARHPVRMIINEFKAAYLSMGFTEISGPVIEPAFWVFDYLFVPQDHPARDVQDTFFLSRPRELQVHDRSLVRRIKAEHEKAWHGEWSEEFASRAILRTHTTSVTGRYINSTVTAMAARKRGFEPPIKFFSVGRVFRNENLDYKHLADFYMHDGIIIGKNLTLAHLFDVLTKIYNSVGVKIRFKPAYFPFVEPGVEVHVLQNGEWLEMGGAGIIRKEVTGIERKTISVLAWGLPIERIALLRKSGVESIVDLYNSTAGTLRRMKV